MPRRSEDGRLIFKIILYGPSLAGKTTIHNFISEHPQFTSRVSSVGFPLYHVSGQRRHKFQRQTVLKECDAIIFVWDSFIDQWGENIWSLKELLRFCGDKLIPQIPLNLPEIPIVFLANKRDLEDIVEISKIRHVLNTARLDHSLIYETIGTEGINIYRAYIYVARQAVLNHYIKLSGKSLRDKIQEHPIIDPIKIEEKIEKLKEFEVLKGEYVVYNGIKFEVREKQLDLSGKGIKNIAHIEGLSNIKFLDLIDLSNNQFSEINGLERLENLKTLNLSNNKIGEIKNLNDLLNLESLELSENKIKEIQGLHTLINLENLNLSNNQISEIVNLDQLVKLEMLNVSGNNIEEIQGLEKMINLEHLYTSGNPVNQLLVDELGGLNDSGKVIEVKNFLKYCEVEDYRTKIDNIVKYKIEFKHSFKKLEYLIKENKVDQAQAEIMKCKGMIEKNRFDNFKEQLDQLEINVKEIERTIIMSCIWGEFKLHIDDIREHLEREFSIIIDYKDLKSFIENEMDGYSLSIDETRQSDIWDVVVPWEGIVSFINSYLNDVPKHQYNNWGIDNLRGTLGFPNLPGEDFGLNNKLKNRLINTIEECKYRGYFTRDIKIDTSFLHVLPDKELIEQIEKLNKRTEDIFQEYIKFLPPIYQELTNINHTLDITLLKLINTQRDRILPTLIEVHNIEVDKEGWQEYKRNSKIWNKISNTIKYKFKLQNCFIFIFRCDNCSKEYPFIFFQESKLSRYLKILFKLAPWVKDIMKSTNSIFKPPNLLDDDSKKSLKISSKITILNLLPDDITFLYKSLIGIDEHKRKLDQIFFVRLDNENLIHTCIHCNQVKREKRRQIKLGKILRS